MNALPPGLVTPPGTSVDNPTAGWRLQRPHFFNEACKGCDLCVLYCPEGIVFQIGPKAYDFDERFCKGCGICVQECPVHDIVMEDETR